MTGTPVSETRTPSLAGSTDEAALAGLRRRALLVSGMGFFTDAYDLFVIGIVSTLLKTQWHLGTDQLALLNAVMLGAAFLGALVFGRLADIIGRTRVYWMSAALMVIAASQGRYGTSEARPNGPTMMPTRMKPSAELACRRWTRGMTTPAAPRTIRASL